MADDFDVDIVQQLLEEAAAQMRIKQTRFGKKITSLVTELYDLVKVDEDSSSAAFSFGSQPSGVFLSPVVNDSMLSPSGTPSGRRSSQGGRRVSIDPTSIDNAKRKKIISARACVVCGRDDRPGEQRSKGFKCHECVGIPSKLDAFQIQIEEMGRVEKKVNGEGEKVINEFTFLHPLGKGSYGKVKLAVHNRSDQKYAAKILNKQSLKKVHKAGTLLTALDAVRSEISILKSLNHPNVIKMYSLIDDPDDTKLYLIMEYCEGGQLYHINTNGTPSTPMETERLKKMIVGIARGLQYLHQKGIVHRDIKPENILLDLHENVKLTDFGVSSECADDDDTMQNTEGSPAYFPPEEFAQIPVKGKAHDIWSFGVTVYAMAFGQLPFRASTLSELSNLVMNTEPAYPPEADIWLVDLIKQMLAKEQDYRPRADQLLEHPFISDVRTVKGYPVETIKVNVHVVEGIDAALLPKLPENTQAILLPINCHDKTKDRRGIEAMTSFMKNEGPEFQIIRSATYSSTLYSMKSDPRRKKLMKEKRNSIHCSALMPQPTLIFDKT